VVVIFLMGVGPALPWRRASGEEVRRKLLAPTIAMLLVFAASVALGVPYWIGVFAYAFAAFALVANSWEFVVGARARMRAHSENVVQALGRLTMANRHRYGGYVAHLGVILFVVGVASSSMYKQEFDRTLTLGVPVEAGGYHLTLRQVWAAEEPQRFVVGADVDVSQEGRHVTRLSPRLNFYPMQQEPLPTPDVREANTDLYLNLMAFERDGSSATVTFFIEPLVIWIWIGTVVLTLGTGIALWPEKKRRRSQPGTPSGPGTARTKPSKKVRVAPSAQPTEESGTLIGAD
jgi:cytochrome c-type biogenesis protein CcmF